MNKYFVFGIVAFISIISVIAISPNTDTDINLRSYTMTINTGGDIELGATNSCTYSGSGTWTIQVSDNCTLNTQTIDSPMIVAGTGGKLTINGTVTAKNISMTPSVFNGGFTVAVLKGFTFGAIK